MPPNPGLGVPHPTADASVRPRTRPGYDARLGPGWPRRKGILTMSKVTRSRHGVYTVTQHEGRSAKVVSVGRISAGPSRLGTTQ